MQKVFLVIFTAFFLMAAPNAWALRNDVYRVNCLPEVGVMEIQRYSTTEKGQTKYFSDPANMEEKGYHNPLWELGRPDMYTHQCMVNGQQLLVKMDGLSYTKEKHGRPCAWDIQSTLRMNAWLNGKMIIDNLRFDGGCKDYEFSLGESIESITIRPFAEDTKNSEKASEVWIYIETLELEGYLKKRHGVDFSLDDGKDNEFFKGTPLTNADVHGADIDKKFPPDLQAP